MNVLRRSSLTTLAAASLAAFPLSAAAAQEASALTRIEAAFQEGRIDAPTRALYGLYLMKDHTRLPAELRPTGAEEPLRCGTFLWKRALNEIESMDAGQRASYATMGGRPAGVVGTVLAITNEVRVHYVNGADAGLAAQVATYADESWTTEVTTMGWRAPVLDSGADAGGGPSTDLDLYIADTGFGGAYCAPEDPGPGVSDDYSTFIVLDPTIPANVMNTYVAHEFNHSLQFAYSASEADWLYESTATYMEDKVYDAINDYVYFITDFQGKPERTFSYATYSDTYMYGGAVFHHFLSDVYDAGNTTAVRDLWDLAEGGGNFFQAAAQITGKSFEELYAEFAGYRWLSGSNSDGWSDEAASWPRVPKIGTHVLESASGTSAKPPMKLGANYVEIDAAGAVNGDKITFTLNGEAGTDWAVTIIRQPPTAAATITTVLDDDGDGTVIAVSENNDGLDKVVFAAVNLGVAGQDPDNSSGGSGHTADITTSDLSYEVFYSATGGDPTKDEPVACGCSKTGTPATPGTLFAGFLAAAAMLVVKRRRA